MYADVDAVVVTFFPQEDEMNQIRLL